MTSHPDRRHCDACRIHRTRKPGRADGTPDRRVGIRDDALGPTPESLAPYADTAAKYAESPAELGAVSDLVCLCVVNDDDVRQVITGKNGVLEGMNEGGIIAVHSTIHPDTCRELAAAARERGVSLVDAPVSGGGMGAAAGTLLVMVGGESDVVERCRPVFSTYGDPVVHLGELGAGLVAKLLNNLLFTANLALAENTLALGAELGVDPTRSVRSSHTARRTASRSDASCPPGAASPGSAATPVSC